MLSHVTVILLGNQSYLLLLVLILRKTKLAYCTEKKYRIEPEVVTDAPSPRSSPTRPHSGRLVQGKETLLYSGYPLHRENRKNTGNLEMLPKYKELGLLKL